MDIDAVVNSIYSFLSSINLEKRATKEKVREFIETLLRKKDIICIVGVIDDFVCLELRREKETINLVLGINDCCGWYYSKPLMSFSIS